MRRWRLVSQVERFARTRRTLTYAGSFGSDLVRLSMTAIAYLAGPDVFLPNAAEHAAAKVEICRRSGLRGLPPLNEDADTAAAGLEVWRAIYQKDVAMMEKSDIIIANLTPFAGASADSGTLIEVGWFLGKGKPIFGYSNTAESFESRMRRQLGAEHADLGIEGFHLPDNLNCRSGRKWRIPDLSSNRRQGAWPRCARRVRDLRGGGGATCCQPVMSA
jgi:nucleoside 2-deoxyribosyltransferase